MALNYWAPNAALASTWTIMAMNLSGGRSINPPLAISSALAGGSVTHHMNDRYPDRFRPANIGATRVNHFLRNMSSGDDKVVPRVVKNQGMPLGDMWPNPDKDIAVEANDPTKEILSSAYEQEQEVVPEGVVVENQPYDNQIFDIQIVEDQDDLNASDKFNEDEFIIEQPQDNQTFEMPLLVEDIADYDSGEPLEEDQLATNIDYDQIVEELVNIIQDVIQAIDEDQITSDTTDVTIDTFDDTASYDDQEINEEAVIVEENIQDLEYTLHQYLEELENIDGAYSLTETRIEEIVAAVNRIFRSLMGVGV